MRSLSPPFLSHPWAAGSAGRAEQLFRAAVTAFCALTRPPRVEIERIDALTVSLLDYVPASAKRFAAAAFSDAPQAPPGLVRRLCEDSIDVAAPLLARSPLLSDTDLVELIGHQGLGHARAISRRPGLNPTIAGLISVLLRHNAPIAAEPERGADSAIRQDMAAPRKAAAANAPALTPALHARDRLRGMMAEGGGESNLPLPDATYRKLRETALDGHLPFFQTALADLTGLSLAAARRIAEDGWSALPGALRALGLTSDQAFLVAAALHPQLFAAPGAVRLFLDRFESLPRGTPIGLPQQDGLPHLALRRA